MKLRRPSKPASKDAFDFLGTVNPLQKRNRPLESKFSAELLRITVVFSQFCARPKKQAQFRDTEKTLDNFDFTFNPTMDRSLVSSVVCLASWLP